MPFVGVPRLPHGVPRAPPLPACMNRSYVALAMERLSKFCFAFEPQGLAACPLSPPSPPPFAPPPPAPPASPPFGVDGCKGEGPSDNGTEVVLSGCPTETLSRYRLYGAAEPPPPPVAVPSPPPPPLECAAECKVRVSIEQSTLLRNNLGALGPWRGGEAEIRVGHVGELEGRPFDLRIRNTSEYRAPSAGLLNGLAEDGRFVSISLLEGTAVDLSLSFVNSQSDAPVELPCLHLGAFGLHNGDNGDALCRESVTTPTVGESALASGFESVFLPPHTKLASHVDERGDLHITSGNLPAAADWPLLGPSRLSEHQQGRSVLLRFHEVRALSLRLGYTAPPGGDGSRGGGPAGSRGAGEADCGEASARRGERRFHLAGWNEGLPCRYAEAEAAAAAVQQASFLQQAEPPEAADNTPTEPGMCQASAEVAAQHVAEQQAGQVQLCQLPPEFARFCDEFAPPAPEGHERLAYCARFMNELALQQSDGDLCAAAT